MLNELKAMHAEIARFLDELETLAGEEKPRLETVAAVRLKLTRASRRRTTLLETSIYPSLLDSASEPDRQRIEALRDSGREGLIASIGHIGRWTIVDLGQRWREYRVASQRMRRSMRDRIAQEQALLYPLLEQQAGRAA